ncbi:UNKNOWN [Stylonychia lemnae]|uniref:Uncharacterized protein n=1 Tax=Stylonychia lemnae TaxID=5949 RepID=A0A077ZTJ1_STYLE|nr:UNKNOWN [Stylonychia lemnae]|eukprot:CDW72655.1 UNKNOWN [Stylonychia lemnae]
MRDIKESYGHLKSFKPAGDAEKSTVKVSKNPHQDILDKLMNRPFLKHKVMTSRSVKSFIFDIFEDGLKEDMVIFEPNFVRKYPQFSTEYLDLHFHYNSTSGTLFNPSDTDFLNTYDTIVQPRRWARPYAGIQDSYSKNTQALVFQSHENQASLFKKPIGKKPYQVFRCEQKPKDKGRNLIMETLRHKITQTLYLKSEEYLKARFQAFNDRKQFRVDQSLQLPQINIDQKKDVVLQTLKEQDKMKRALSEQVLTQEILYEADLQKLQQKNLNNQSLTDLFQNEISRNSYKIQKASSTESDIKNLKASRSEKIYQGQNSSLLKSQSQSQLFPHLNNKSSFITNNNSFGGINQSQISQYPQKEYSDEVKKHFEVTSIIQSLRTIIKQLLQEKEKNKPDPHKIEEHIEMATLFLEKLYHKYDQVHNDKVKQQLIDVIERIDELIYQSSEKVEKLLDEEDESRNEVQSALRHYIHRNFKASLLQKLSLIHMKKNQLKNTNTKQRKFYEKSEKQQHHELRDFIKSNNSYMKSNNNHHHMNMTRFTKQSIADKSTQEQTLIMKQMNDKTSINNDISKLLSPVQNTESTKQNKNIMIKNQHDNQFDESEISQNIDTFRHDDNENSVMQPIAILSPNKTSMKKRLTYRKQVSLKAPSHQQKLQSLLKRKANLNSFNKLVSSKDMTNVNEKTDVLKAVKQCIEEFGPYKFYDEVIQDYFGGHIDIQKLMDQSDQQNDNQILESERNADATSVNSLERYLQNQKIKESEKQEAIRQAIVERTLRDLIILAKEDSMTNLKAIQSIQNHVVNEKTLSFKQKQEKSTLVDYLKQLPSKIKASNDQSIDNIDDFYNYKDDQKNSSQYNEKDKKGEAPMSPLGMKVVSAVKQKLGDIKNKQVGFDTLLFAQDLKLFHNEYDIPILVDKYIKKYGANGDVMDFQRKNLIFYRKQLDSIEQKLIKLIQKFN